MNILIINAGSSSLKYQLMDPNTGDVAAKGLCERIYIDGRLTHKVGDKKVVKDIPMPSHSEAIAAVLEILDMDYLRTARAKGIGRKLVINKHATRNALLPIITVIGMEIPVLFGGSIIIEQIFSWPGLGLITMNAIVSRDYPVIMGVCLLSGVVVLAANLITDILYALADPTIRY